MNGSGFIQKLAKSPKFKPFLRKLALFAAIVTLVGLVLRLMGKQIGFDPLLVMGMGTLAMVSFLLPYAYPNPPLEEQKTIPGVSPVLWCFAMCLSGWGGAVLLVGLLFLIERWPGWRNMLVAGVGVAPFALAVWIWYFHRRRKSIERGEKVWEDE